MCNRNMKQLEKMYNTYLLTEADVEHTNVLFAEYLREYGEEICPNDGDIIYLEGNVQCNLYSNHNKKGDNDVEEEDDGWVPFL